MSSQKVQIMEYETYEHSTSDRLRIVWIGMICRCRYPSNFGYKWYGGRGIRVCDEWLSSPESFFKWALENGYNDSLTLDRIDPLGNYEPSNCRWVTMAEQAKNKRVSA